MISSILGGVDTRSALTDPDWPGWEDIGGRRSSDSGIKVGRDDMLRLPAVWQAIAMISGDIAALPLNLYRKEGVDGTDRQVYERHPAHWLVRNKTNNVPLTAMQFWRQMLGDALLWNNAYAWIRRGGDQRPVELLPLLPDRTCAEFDPNGERIYVTEVSETGDLTNTRRRVKVLGAYDVIHLRGIMITDPSGEVPSFLTAAREAVGLGLAAQKFQARFFRNGMATKGILELPAGMPKTARDKVEEGFTKAHTGEDGWFRTVILREGAKFHSISQSNKDGESHELRMDQVRDVARLFNLPPSKLGLSDSVSYNSKAEDNKDYHQRTLSPWLRMISEECWLKMLLNGEQRAGQLYFEHNTQALLRDDTQARYNSYQIGLSQGFLLKSEVRKFENLPEVPGIDDEPEAVEVMPDDDSEADPPEEKERAWPTRERDEWLAEKKQRHSWAELELMLQDVADDRGWTVLTIGGLRAAVSRCSMLSTS